jgi:hypothetical protein
MNAKIAGILDLSEFAVLVWHPGQGRADRPRTNP